MSILRRPLLLACLVAAAPAARAQASPAPAGEWSVAAIGGTVVDAGADITFGPDGRAYGRSFCNRFTGGFTLEGQSLRFGPVAGTRMACEPPAMELEQRFHAAIEAVRRWRADGEALLLVDGDGVAVLRLRRG